MKTQFSRHEAHPTDHHSPLRQLNRRTTRRRVDVVRWRSLLLVGLLSTMASTTFSAETSESIANSLSSDWTSASSGWKDERVPFGNKAPVGTFKLEYKHWFNAPAEPAAWTLHASPAKPAAADWSTVANITDTVTTTSAAGSTAKSEWEIDPYEDPLGLLGYYAKYNTRSKANAIKPDTEAHSRTRVTDPWHLTIPDLDLDWDPILFPLDPDGKWEVLTQISLAGEITGTGGIGSSYWMALDSDPLKLIPYLSIDITSAGATVTTPDLPGGLDLTLYVGNHASAVATTPAALASMINAYLTPGGWSLGAGLDFASIMPDQDAYLDQVLGVFAFVHLPSTVHGVTIHTEARSSADAYAEPVPDGASTLGFLGSSMLAFTAVSAFQRKSSRGRRIGQA